METGVQQKISTTSPLGTISPQRVNNFNVSSTSSQQDREDEQLQAKIQRQENQILQKLKTRDREVRAHEAAHMAAGRPFVTGGPSYTYQRGPDGRSYAIGGEVNLDTAEVANDPEATLSKAETVRRAALAPAEPSSQDLRVAADATQMAAQARLELAVLRREQSQVPAEGAESRNRIASEPSRNNQAIQAFTSNDIPSFGLSQFA